MEDRGIERKISGIDMFWVFYGDEFKGLKNQWQCQFRTEKFRDFK
jgi:hypothetical protein